MRSDTATIWRFHNSHCPPDSKELPFMLSSDLKIALMETGESPNDTAMRRRELLMINAKY